MSRLPFLPPKKAEIPATQAGVVRIETTRTKGAWNSKHIRYYFHLITKTEQIIQKHAILFHFAVSKPT